MVFIQSTGMICPMGGDGQALRHALRTGMSPGIVARDGWLVTGEPCVVGEVSTALPEIPLHLGRHNSRNNQLLLAAVMSMMSLLEDAVARFGRDRIGVILGTSTSGLEEGFAGIRNFRNSGEFPDGYAYEQQELGDPSMFLSEFLGLRGPSYTISTACSSSSRAIISGQRLLKSGVVDAVLVGGSDSLCHMTLNGFYSLEALSRRGCRPFARERDGITIGEAAALLLMTREPSPISLAGVGESSDAYHISAPHPEGVGAISAMRRALDDAGCEPAEVGYVNLHGTGTPLNDEAESLAVNAVFGAETPCSSTKHLTGHALGTCGALEAVIGVELLLESKPVLPFQNMTPEERDPVLAPIGLILKQSPVSLEHPMILSNSFAFGGNNTALLFRRET